MNLSYEFKFKLYFILFIIIELGLFFIPLPPVVRTILQTFILIIGLILSAKSTWWIPRVSRKLPIFLMLHSVSSEVVDPISPNNTLRPEELESLIQNLLHSGYTFQTAIDAIQNPRPRSVVLTFDDGLIDNYTILFPILKKFNIPATLFVTNRGESNAQEFLTVAQIQEMAKSGLVEFGGHTAEHTVLNTVSPEIARKTIDANYAWLSQILGKPPRCFAYPCGGYDESTIQILKDVGYDYAFTMKKKMRPVAIDPYQIHRQIIPRGKTPIENYLLATRGKYRV